VYGRFGQYPGWQMPGRMMSQRGGARGRAPIHAGRGGYYGGKFIVYSRLPLYVVCAVLES